MPQIRAKKNVSKYEQMDADMAWLAKKSNWSQQIEVPLPDDLAGKKNGMTLFKYRLQSAFYTREYQSLLPENKCFVKYESECGNYIIIVVEDRGER